MKDTRTKIKICGLRRREDVELVNRYRPDLAGFVFAPSRRQVTWEQASALAEGLQPEIRKVGVFVDAPLEEIRRICSREIIDVIQLHGRESAEQIKWLQEYTGKPVIKAVRVRSQEQILRAGELPCECLLLDTYSAGQAGGTGETFDLRLIPSIHRHFFLAGGLCPENVGERIGACRPYGVDVSSGVETAGWKDAEKIRRFVEQVREADVLREPSGSINSCVQAGSDRNRRGERSPV